ncbi:MAG: hypothetical protein M3044_05655 [Thermoproteota archaeon]|nr:hypothetical protein [Thermoproteota archaeon]
MTYIYDLLEYKYQNYSVDEFARLKTLDVIFNICLIIDETLKKAESKAKSITLPASHKMSDGILWICDSKGWMKSNDLQTFWNKNNLNVAASNPDVIIPKLLCMNELYNGNPVKREVFSLLLAYNLRNYGGHNIDQQFELTRSYDAIIKQLLMALFLCVEAL